MSHQKFECIPDGAGGMVCEHVAMELLPALKLIGITFLIVIGLALVVITICYGIWKLLKLRFNW